MYKSIFFYFVFLNLQMMGAKGIAAESCLFDGNIEFICGPVNPEDLYQIPNTHWVVVSGSLSSSRTEGSLYAVNTLDHSSHVIFPEDALLPAHDMQNYPDCPGPNNSSFQPHGISIREGQLNLHTLYVVGHGNREAIEVFTMDVSGDVPTLQWIGCVVAPEGVKLFNAVTVLPDGGIAATDFDPLGGELWEWNPISKWVEVPGSKMRAPNGLVVSADAQWFYIGGWIDQTLVRLSRGKTPPEINTISVEFRTDNLRWAPDGKLLLAGQTINCEESRNCRMAGTGVVKVDPVTLEVNQLINYPDNDLFKMGTVAIEIEEQIWVGGLRDGQGIAVFPKTSLDR